jgi:tRNA pseudouridine55 synthase
MKSGFLLINKPSGPTSHDIIDELRKITGEQKIGHAGTLDPFASGLLIVAVGREATRNITQFVKQDKTYIAKLHLGAVSDTYDRTGKLRITNDELQITKTEAEKILKKFIGKQTQVPPMYSAKKIGGKKLYELARKGVEIERKPAEIDIKYIKLLESSPVIPDAPSEVERQYSGIQKKNNWIPHQVRDDTQDVGAHITIETRVSSGTYIRALAHDIGQALGCGAYLEELQRTEIGGYKLKDAVETKKLTKNNWQEKLFQK